MRVVFKGTSGFAVPALEALVAAGHEILLVVTQPDRRSGRRLELHTSAIKQTAERLGLPLFQPERIREESAVERIRSVGPIDAIAVAAFGQIIPKSILDIPKFGSVNLHASLLPRYRGAAPIQRAIAAGETCTGVTSMLMDPGLDTGDILLQEETRIEPEETAGELEERLARMGAGLLVRTLEGLENGAIKPTPQDHSHATLAPSIKREEGEIDWGQPAKAITNKIRGFTPRPGTYTLFSGRTIKIGRAKLALESGDAGPPGQVVLITKDGIEVAAGDGSVFLLEVQPEGRRQMSAGEFAHGAHLDPGVSRLGTTV